MRLTPKPCERITDSFDGRHEIISYAFGQITLRRLRECHATVGPGYLRQTVDGKHYDLTERVNPAEQLNTHVAENEMIDVCTENKVHRGGLGPHEAFVQNLWYAKGAVFSIQCYFWCNDEGIVPKRHHDSEASSESLSVLVSGNIIVPELESLTSMTNVCISSSMELCP